MLTDGGQSDFIKTHREGPEHYLTYVLCGQATTTAQLFLEIQSFLLRLTRNNELNCVPIIERIALSVEKH